MLVSLSKAKERPFDVYTVNVHIELMTRLSDVGPLASMIWDYARPHGVTSELMAFKPEIHPATVSASMGVVRLFCHVGFKFHHRYRTNEREWADLNQEKIWDDRDMIGKVGVVEKMAFIRVDGHQRQITIGSVSSIFSRELVDGTTAWIENDDRPVKLDVPEQIAPILSAPGNLICMLADDTSLIFFAKHIYGWPFVRHILVLDWEKRAWNSFSIQLPSSYDWDKGKANPAIATGPGVMFLAIMETPMRVLILTYSTRPFGELLHSAAFDVPEHHGTINSAAFSVGTGELFIAFSLSVGAELLLIKCI